MQVMSAEELKKCCLLVLANKQDLPNAMTISEISEKLELNKLPEDRHWRQYYNYFTQFLLTLK